MRVDRAAMLLTLATLIGVSSGCARWTLFPQSTPSAGQQANLQQGEQQQGEQQQRTGLLQAAGLRRGSNEQAQANADGRKQEVVNDLTHLDPALALARLAERQGEPSEARRQYQRYIDKNPSHPLPHHRLGVMAAREAKYDQAEAHFQNALRLAPPTAELLSDVGYLFYLQDRLGEAENMLRQATQMEPANHTANNNLAKVLAARGNFDQSLQHFRRVNDEAQARANLAYMHSHRGNLNKSREEYLRALTLDNTLSNAAHALLQVEEARKREEVALANLAAGTGDELIASNASQQAQTQAAAAQHQGHVAHNQPLPQPPVQMAQAQASYGQSMQPQGVQQAVASQQPAPAAVSNHQQQARLLMPIPEPPTEAATTYPSGNFNYPETGVQQASHAETASPVQPASHVETTSRFTNEAAAVQSISDRAPVTEPREDIQPSTQPAPAEKSQWNDAWRQLSTGVNSPAATGAQTDDTTSEESTSSGGGVRISIGG